MSRRLRAFKRWMRSKGVDCSDALRLTDAGEENGGISVVALCDLKEGDLVATIPKSTCLTVKASGACDAIEDAGLEGLLGLAVALMYERSLGSASPWHGYLQLLPERECVPVVWSLEEVDAFLTGTELHKVVKQDKSYVYEDWKEYIEPLIASGPLKIYANTFGVEQYFSAKSLVSSRSFQIDDYYGSGMVPLADLFNHKTGAENVHFTTVCSSSNSDDEDNGNAGHESGDDRSSIVDSDGSSSEDDPTVLEMIVVRDVGSGNEVFNTYGSMGNAALLHRYGFTEVGNQYDIVNIDLSLVSKWCSSSFSGRYTRARVSLWKRLDYAGCISQDSEYFEVSFYGKPQVDLLVLLYIIFLGDSAYEELGFAIHNFERDAEYNGIITLMKITGIESQKLQHIKAPKDVIELLMTESVCSALISLADLRESLYGCPLEEDKEKLKECCRFKERKLYHSLVLRVSERMILAKLREHASKCKTIKKRKAPFYD